MNKTDTGLRVANIEAGKTLNKLLHDKHDRSHEETVYLKACNRVVLGNQGKYVFEELKKEPYRLNGREQN